MTLDDLPNAPAASVVTKDVAEKAIVVGSPAKVVRSVEE